MMKHSGAFQKFVNNPKNEKYIVAVIIVLAVLSLFLIFAPNLKRTSENNGQSKTSPVEDELLITEADSSPTQYDASYISVTPAVPTPSASPTPSPSPDDIFVRITGTSTERDLYLFVRNAEGIPVEGTIFTLTVYYPNGEICDFDTENDGSCYLVNLDAGDYRVEMRPHTGYITPEPITCSVKARIEYQKIEEIEDIIEVHDAYEIIDEVKVNDSPTGEETVAEVIITPETQPVAEARTESVPVLDQNGNQTYTYSFSVGENGHLLYSDGTESNVFPNVEDDVLLFGLVQDEETGTYSTVELFNADNTPISEFSITAQPVFQEISSTEALPVTVGWQNIDGNIYYYNQSGQAVTGLKNIDGKLYYFSQYGVKASKIGIDVSFYNGAINWPAVKNAGIDFVIIRVGGRGWESGLIYDDSCFYQYIQGAKAAGLAVGVYFYSTAVTAKEAVEEASIVLERLNGVYLDYPVFIDMEYSGDYPDGRADTLSAPQRIEIAQAFCETVKSYNYTPGIYAGLNYFRYELNYASLSQYYIWLANYTVNNSLPNFNNRYDMWQFTDSGLINGIPSFADMNVIF